MKQEHTDEIYIGNGAFYAIRKTGLIQSGRRFHEKIGILCYILVRGERFLVGKRGRQVLYCVSHAIMILQH